MIQCTATHVSNLTSSKLLAMYFIQGYVDTVLDFFLFSYVLGKSKYPGFPENPPV